MHLRIYGTTCATNFATNLDPLPVNERRSQSLVFEAGGVLFTGRNADTAALCTALVQAGFLASCERE